MRKVLLSKPTRLLGFAAVAAIAWPLIALSETPSSLSAGPKPFSSMAITADDAEACRVPRPPSDLAETAYLCNGYRAILRILIAERSLETETCDCLLSEFTWDMLLNSSRASRHLTRRVCPSKCWTSTPWRMRLKQSKRRPARSKWGLFVTF